MKKKFKNKYRIESNRFPGWDYSGSGFYFLTFVTQNRICNLGEIVNSKIELSEYGQIVAQKWVKSFEIRKELFCDSVQIMPNHIHAIIKLDKSELDDTESTISIEKIFDINNFFREPAEFRMRPKSISSFVAGFKSGVNSSIDDFIDANKLKTDKFNRNNHFFQPDYYDHIIRNKSDYFRIKKYIENNPSKWAEDAIK
tara:strand:- start:18061 stop:18654 length:594 start_codon:yes stop_codon:yes gene_type:complete